MDLEGRFNELTKKALAEAMNMSLEDLDRFMTSSFSSFLGAIREGKCIGILDYEGRARGLFNIPVTEDKIRGFGNLTAPDMKVNHFLGLVTDKSHQRKGRICAIEAHDWRESGLYHVKFADEIRENFPDDKPDKFRKFLRSPEYCVNAGTWPITYELFLMAYRDQGGDLIDLGRDYKKLFDADLPRPRSPLSR